MLSGSSLRTVACVAGLLLPCVLLPGCGSNTNASAAAELQTLQIFVQPASQSVQAGQSVTFTVGIQGSSAVTYQWYENMTAVQRATAGSFTIASPNVSQSGTILSVQVADSEGHVTSTGATLTVTPIVASLTFGPIATITYGVAPFVVGAGSASTAPVSYAVVSGPAAITGSTLTVSGAGTVVLAATQPASGNYAAANAQTSFTVAPATPALAFAPLPAISFGAAPFGVTASSTSSGAIGYSVVSGPATLAGAELSITGAGPVVLAASQAATTNYTAASAQASFTVGPNVSLTAITPATLTLAPGQQAFSSTAAGGQLDTVTWSATGGTFAGNLWTSPNIAGTYTVTATSVDQPSRFVSTPVTVSGPVITTQPRAQSLCSSNPLSLSVAAQYATGFQWYLGAVPIAGATSSTYTASNLTQASNGGAYSVAVSNPAATVTSSPATVNIGSTITSNPASQTVTASQPAAFSVAAQGQSPFTYQWFSLAPGASTGSSIAGATASSYAPASSPTASGTQFYADVTDSCGTTLTSTNATLTVQAPPTITTQPASQSAAAGGPATLSVVASGTPALAYQWFWIPSGLHQATPIAGATSATYPIPASSTTAGNTGDAYFVTVTNAYGEATSQNALLGVSSSPANASWVVGWGANPEDALPGSENPGGESQSFRSFFYPTVTGTMERVHLSNLYNTVPVIIGAARLATASGSNGVTGDAIDPTHDAPLTFNGSSTVTLAPGQEIVSDPVQIPYTFGQKLAVSLFVQGSYPALTQHESQVNTNFATPSGAGDTTTDASGTSFTQSNTEWFVLTGVDVYGAYQGTIAFFGSSSVDGHNSNDGNTNSYPAYNNVPIPSQDDDRPSDWLARQLIAAGYNLGVLNAGTLGDSAAEDAHTATGAAVAGVDRLNHDVLQQAGIKAVVIYIGGVDLRSDCVPATNVEASLTNIVQQAEAAGVRVILGTIPPSEYCTTVQPLPSATYPYNGDEFLGPLNPSAENPGSTQRRLVNDWIRTTGPTLPGVVGIADFDQALADPNHPDFLMPNFVSADLFHPNGVGYGVQSSAVPLNLLLAPSN